MVIKKPHGISRKEWHRCPDQISSTGPCQSWPPNNPHPLDCLYDSLSSPPVAGVWWAHWRRCPVAAVASSKWMLHIGGGSGETPPPMIVKHFGCTTIHSKALYKCIIHSIIYCTLIRIQISHILGKIFLNMIISFILYFPFFLLDLTTCINDMCIQYFIKQINTY